MTQTILIYFLASIILYLILNYLEKLISENFYHYIIITQIYLLFVSGILTSYHLIPNTHSLFLIVLFEFFLRIFLFYYQEDPKIKSTSNDFQKQLLNVITSYLLTFFFINKVETVFLTTSELKILIWMLILIYLYTNLKKYSKQTKEKNTLFQKKEGEYIVIQYAKLKNQYGHFVKSKYKELIPVIYTIMIYENYNRPFIIRKLDLFFYKIDQEKRKFGIMQVTSNTPLTDEKSITITIHKLERIYTKNIYQKDSVFMTLKKYYPKTNIDNLLIIYKKIVEFKNI